ncbi:bifunctional phosphopantothenoylcysteine decarboxylase/phosphopantothenate synthase [Arthrobacter sp. CAU 1506]|uniref:bifunctional phosphopantothenoylcysteine decarboxylase/phosphopantothenate synthase n=1 Tax=Arthrobacter sp. CAU 1506 TaxID=2560052 RepID=UPI0010AC24FF|nr:bifunctional phosphopantothenoylcysteine decarboxylase/phosphopantothenate synthase [Arthrobacter sp. CAU 1506]TJY70376.1 bifunctional phosphopantothenoylcysteine decarboxylase/phosphopantothenate synthase [Arthrobacter sp. CAU 1506]
MRIILGVGGGIAAYKSASLLRLFKEAGHDVTVMPTDAAEKFVGRATWEALSGNPVSNSVFDDVESVNHVRLGQEADLVVVCPATADLLARAAAGLAGDLLTNTLLVATAPVVFVPAMHTEMWQHPATVANVATLRSRGSTVMDPAVGRLTGKDTGPGRLPEPADIYAFITGGLADGTLKQRPTAVPDPAASLATQRGTSAVTAPEAAASGSAEGAAEAVSDAAAAEPGPLAGKRVLITVGGTREPLDPVRFLGNRSSGKQGVALARAAAAAGAEVELIAAHLEVAIPDGIKSSTVETALDLREATLEAAARSDVVIMAAAVADFRPSEVTDSKIKKRDDAEDPVITLVRNPDILVEIVQQRGTAGTPLIIGFAAETGDDRGNVLDYARSKLERKGCDLLVLNRVGRDLVFGQDDTEITVLARSGAEPQTHRGSKDSAAAVVIKRIVTELSS